MAELVSIKRNVDVSPGQAAPAVFHCSQGDVGSKIILGLLNNGTAYAIPSGVTVTIEGSESNGSIFTPISATVSGSDITFYLTGEMTAVAGPAICQAVLKSGSNILGTANFTLEVESSPMGADAPPVFTDAGWTWMLNKLTTEFVPALGDNIIDAIESKADQSNLTALSNTVTGHTGSITVLNNTVNTLNHDVRENRQNIALKLDKNQGTANAGKYLKVQSGGQVVPVDLIDNSLLVETMAADAKATGVAISKKLNKYFGQAEAGKYLKVGTSGYVDSADLDVTTDKTLSIADKAADAKAVGDELDDLKVELNDIVETYKPRNLYDYTKAEKNKYLNPNGKMETYNGRYVTDYIDAIPGKYIVCSYIASNNALTRAGYAAICCYDANKNVVAGGNYNKPSFLVPGGVSYVRVTVSGTLYGETVMIENSDTDMPTVFEFYHAPTQFINKEVSVYPENMGFMTIRGDLSDGESLYLSEHNVKNDNVLSFTANITSFNSLQVGKGADAVVTLDGTNIIIHSDQGNYTEAHGLTIENNIQVLITNKTDTNADIVRITSNGISHTVTGTHRFIMDEGSPFVTSVGSVLTDGVFSWTSRNINKPIWLFGDSYISWYASRWPYYLAEDGYTKSCMLNGYAGESVVNGMKALRSLLAVRIPDYVVWCLGMNNADGSSAVSSAWKLAYDELIGLSNTYGFTLILATIPNTPTVNNSYKNEIVRNSGYRYIDFATAVNIPDTNNWYSGMLSSDNVHPTVSGAKALYGQVLADFPEITSL